MINFPEANEDVKDSEYYKGSTMKRAFPEHVTEDVIDPLEGPLSAQTKKARYKGFNEVRVIGATTKCDHSSWNEVPLEGNIFSRATKFVENQYDGKIYEMFGQERFHRGMVEYENNKIVNSLQVVAQHLTGDALLPSKEVEVSKIQEYFTTHTNLQLIELLQFNKHAVHKKNLNYSRIMCRKKRRDPDTKYTKKKINVIEYWRVFERKGGVLLLVCSIRNNDRKLHAITLNLDEGFLYEGGQEYIDFSKGKSPTKSSWLALLAEFNIATIQNVYLVTRKEVKQSNHFESLYNGISL